MNDLADGIKRADTLLPFLIILASQVNSVLDFNIAIEANYHHSRLLVNCYRAMLEENPASVEIRTAGYYIRNLVDALTASQFI